MNSDRIRMLLATVTLLCLVVTGSLTAQAPRTISYQGILRDAHGPLKGPHSLTVRLYTVGGDAVYTESHSVVFGPEGMFNVVIGSATPIPASVSFAEPYVLGVIVDDGEEMSPRMPLASAPYALNAGSVNGIAGAVVLQGLNGITVTESGNTITISGSTGLTLPFADSTNAPTTAFNVTSKGSGRAGLFAAHGQVNLGPALEGVTTSTRDAGSAFDGVSGVVGRVQSLSSGAYAAGVRGINQSITGEGIGVVGYQAGSGWGVYGEVHGRGIGVYGYVRSIGAEGVRGEAVSTDAVGVNAVFAGPEPGTALEITNGAVTVTGANRPGFVHVATASNRVDSNVTVIDNPLLNGNANAVIVVTHQITVPSGGGRPIYNTSPIGVFYDAFQSRWQVHYESGATIPLDTKFNVWVVNQK